jgi:hypothetical protein
MISRPQLLGILARHLPGASGTDRAAAADAVLESIGEWEDITDRADLDQHFASECADVAYLADQLQRGRDFRVLQRRAR